MATFRDSAGREWSLRLTMRTVRDIKEKTGVNLTTLLDDGLQMYAEILTNSLEVSRIVAVLIADQLKASGLTDDQFADSIYGDALSGMVEAFNQAFCDFIPSRQGEILRNLTATILQEQKNTQEALLKSISTGSASSSPESAESNPGTTPSGNSHGCRTHAAT